MKLEMSLILSQIVAFLLMLWVLKKFAWKPLLKILNERKDKIQSEFDKIEGEKKEIERLTDLYQEKLQLIEDEAKQKIADAVLSGQKMAQKIQEEAHNQAKVILLKAQGAIQNEMLKAKQELKDQLVETIIQATQTMIREKMDTEKDKQLMSDLINKAYLNDQI